MPTIMLPSTLLFVYWFQCVLDHQWTVGLYIDVYLQFTNLRLNLLMAGRKPMALHKEQPIRVATSLLSFRAAISTRIQHYSGFDAHLNLYTILYLCNTRLLYRASAKTPFLRSAHYFTL